MLLYTYNTTEHAAAIQESQYRPCKRAAAATYWLDFINHQRFTYPKSRNLVVPWRDIYLKSTFGHNFIQKKLKKGGYISNSELNTHCARITHEHKRLYLTTDEKELRTERDYENIETERVKIVPIPSDTNITNEPGFKPLQQQTVDGKCSVNIKRAPRTKLLKILGEFLVSWCFWFKS